MMNEKFLTKRQKAVLCQLAQRAFVAVSAAGWYGNVADYRHAVVQEVCGVSGLSEARQGHYVPIYNTFARAAGVREMADRTPKNELEREVYLLREEMQRFELTESYVVSLMMDRLSLRCPMPFDSLCYQLGAEGVRQVKFTVINRGRQKLREAEEEHDLPQAVEFRTAATMPPERLAEHLGCEEVAEEVRSAKAEVRKGKGVAV